jgi:hypothetical protein
MKNAKSSTRSRLHADGLTLAQQSAVDLLAAGHNDTETAELLKLNRVTVTRWRLYSPEFRAALAVRRADIWGAAADRLRSLIPQAVDTLADALDNPDTPDRVTVALAVLKLVGPLPLTPTDPTDPEEYIRQTVKEERERAPSDFDRMVGDDKNLPTYEAHHETVRKRLARLSTANEPEPGPPRTLAPAEAEQPDPPEPPQ